MADTDSRAVLTDKQLQTLRNMGNECEDAADEIVRLRAALAQPAPQEVAEPMARAHPDGRVIPESVYASGARQGGASWTAVKDYTIKLYPHPAPPAVEVRPDIIQLLDAYVAAHCDWFATGHQSAQAYAALARSNLLDALATPSDLPARIRALPHGWRLEIGVGGFSEKGDRWVCIRHLESQCGQDFYEDRDPLIFAFLDALAAADLAADGGAR